MPRSHLRWASSLPTGHSGRLEQQHPSTCFSKVLLDVTHECSSAALALVFGVDSEQRFQVSSVIRSGPWYAMAATPWGVVDEPAVTLGRAGEEREECGFDVGQLLRREQLDARATSVTALLSSGRAARMLLDRGAEVTRMSRSTWRRETGRPSTPPARASTAWTLPTP
ncbi:MAG: hypothetical protein ABJA34_10030 [Pseudonocardiales bacterium]